MRNRQLGHSNGACCGEPLFLQTTFHTVGVVRDGSDPRHAARIPAGAKENQVQNTITRLLLMVLIVSTFFATAAHAATITVTNTDDSGPGSLRQAVIDAASGDIIAFAVTGTITLTSGEIVINGKGITIEGPGPDLLTISGNDASRVFNISSVDVSDPVSISGLRISNGRSSANGGAISFTGILLIVDNCVFFHNSAQDDVAGVKDGGGIYISEAGAVTITNTTFADNFAGDSGGGIYSRSTAELTISGSVFSGNTAMGSGFAGGGAIYLEDSATAVIGRSSFVDNVAGDGGGIFLRVGSFLDTHLVTDSFFSGNKATAPLDAGRGGGIYSFGATATITGSTFSNNLASNGAGIFNDSGTMTVDNSTLSRNKLASLDSVLPIAVMVSESVGNFSRLMLTNNTFYENAGRTIMADALEGNVATVKNNVILVNADFGSAGCTRGDGGSGIVSLGGNFSTDDSCPGFNQVTPEELNLDVLADNGGPTPTHALLPGSVAIDAVTDCTDVAGNLVTADQRGVPRPQGAACDAGAFELGNDDGHQVSTTNLDTPPATQYSDVLALHAATLVSGSPALGGTVEFFLDDASIGTGNVDNAGTASITRQLLLPPGSYPVKAVYTSSDPAVIGSMDTATLVVTPEAALVAPKADNPVVVAAPGGTFSGTIGPFCFAITELPDGSLGDTSTITEIDPSLTGFVGSVHFSGFTRTGGGDQPRVICYNVTLSGAAPGNYVARATISEGENYAGVGGSGFQIVDPATVSADLLVSLGVDKLNVKQGDLLTYTLTVTNFGPQAAFNVVVNDTLSSGSTFASASVNRGSFTAPPKGQTGTVTWYPGHFDSNSQESAQITVTVIVRGNTTITNIATVSSFSADPNPANNSASITSSVVLESGGSKGGGGGGGGNGGGNGKNR